MINNAQFWTGIYGSTWGGNNADYAPVLAIVLDNNKKAVPQLCGVPLKNYSFSHCTLSWSSTDGNSTSGKVCFKYTSPINLDGTPPIGYTGSWFQGTLVVSSASGQLISYGYRGEISNPVSFPLLNWTGFYAITSYGTSPQSPSLCVQGSDLPLQRT